MNFRIIFCILITVSGYTQNTSFDSLYAHVKTVALTSTPQEVLMQISDLEQLTSTPAQVIEVYLLKASLLRQYGLRDKAISTLQKADSFAVNAQNIILKARIQGTLSTLYRENGIESLGKLALVKAKHWSKKVKDPLELAVLNGNLLQEQAYYYMNSAQFSEAITTLTQGRREFEKVEHPQQRFFYLATTDQLIGDNYIQLGNLDLAVKTLNLALAELQGSNNPQSPLKGFIYRNLGESYLKSQDYETSLLFLNNAIDVAEQSGFLSLKKQVFATLKEYAKQREDREMYVNYNEKYIQLVEQELQVQAKIANYLVASYYEKEGELTLAYTNYVYYSLSIVGGILLFLSYSLYHRRQLLKRNPKTQAVPVSTAVVEVVEWKGELAPENNDIGIDYNYISKEMEELILNGIASFEHHKGFLKHEISLSKLASQIGVNHRYLSYVIKHHKQQDFSSYINTLRIDYIVDLLQKNPEMLKYKISYLADLCGFASHSRFTITFKRIKGMSPSAFIEQIKSKI